MSVTHVDPDYTHVRNAMLESIESQRTLFLETLKIQEEEEKQHITARLTLFETTERERLLLEREQSLSESMIKKELDLQHEYALKRKQTNLEHAIFREERITEIQFDVETERRRLLKQVDDQCNQQIVSFRIKLAEEYGKIQSSIKEQHEWEIARMHAEHDKTSKEEIASLSKKLEDDNATQIAAFKEKLDDEYKRLRAVEKLLLKTDLEDEATRQRDALKKEYDELSAKIQKEYAELSGNLEREYTKLTENLKKDYTKTKQEFDILQQCVKTEYTAHKKMYLDMLEAETISMEKERIIANASEIERFKKELEEMYVRTREESEQTLVKETDIRRAELLRIAEEDISHYKISKRKEISDEIAFIRDRELEEMRASLYTLAMEQIEKKVVDKLALSRV